MFKDDYDYYRQLVDKCLDNMCKDWTDLPNQLSIAMEYSLLAGGKRLRPVLLLASNKLFGGAMDKAMPFACAIEMIHTYSLIHDDLPGMDDDDMRRGRPSNHIVNGVGMAILAGDGLLNGAYELMSNAIIENKYDKNCFLGMNTLAVAAGIRGMIAGQCVDLNSDGNMISDTTLDYIHKHKTGDIITGAIVCGGYIAGASEEDIAITRKYGDCIGFAFQITDDILDIIGDDNELGKPVGSDDKNNKATYPKLYGLEEAKIKAQELVDEAIESISVYGEKADFLVHLAKTILDRNN